MSNRSIYLLFQKRHLAWILKSHVDSKVVKPELFKTNNLEEIIKLLNSLEAVKAPVILDETQVNMISYPKQDEELTPKELELKNKKKRRFERKQELKRQKKARKQKLEEIGNGKEKEEVKDGEQEK